MDQVVPIGKYLAQEKLIREQDIELTYLRHELAQLKRMIFGSKSERFTGQSDGQLTLGLDIEDTAPQAPETEQINYTRKKAKCIY